MMYDYISSARALSLVTSLLYSSSTFEAVGLSVLSQALSKYFAPTVMMNTYFIFFSGLKRFKFEGDSSFFFHFFFASNDFFFKLFSFHPKTSSSL